MRKETHQIKLNMPDQEDVEHIVLHIPAGRGRIRGRARVIDLRIVFETAADEEPGADVDERELW